MWAVPLAAALVALVFAALLARQFAERRRQYQALWAVALLMYSAASTALFLGVLNGWTTAGYRVYWLFGAVLTVPFLAAGELALLVRNKTFTTVLLLVLLFAAAFAVARVRTARIDVAALSGNLPLGKEAFRYDPFVLDLARIYAFPAYFVLVGGALWSAWRMRGSPSLRDRFLGTLGVAVGATIVAAGSAFALTGNLVGFSVTLTTGIVVMFWGFLRASRPVPEAAAGG